MSDFMDGKEYVKCSVCGWTGVRRLSDGAVEKWALQADHDHDWRNWNPGEDDEQ